MISKIYTEDWFGRSNTDYIFDKNDINRGIVKVENHKYSSFLYNEDKAERICSDDELLTKEMLDMIHAVGLSNIAFRLSPNNETACTDGHFIEVGNGKKYQSISDCYEKLDRVIGMTIHECCHCLYTDFKYVRNHVSNYPSIVHYIHNVIEDEIIEQKLIDVYPGYENFLAKLKYNIYEKSANEEETEINTRFQEIIEILFYIVRYPKFISKVDANVLNRHENLFIEIKKIMNMTGCFNISSSTPTIASTNAAIKIYELICNDIEKNGNYNDESSDESLKSNKNSSKSNNDNDDNSNNNSYNVNIADNDYDPNNVKFNPSENDLGDIFNIICKILNEISSESEQKNLNDMNVYHINIENTIKEIPDFRWDKCKDNHINNLGIHIWEGENVSKYNMYKREISQFIGEAKKLIITNRRKQHIITTKFNRNGTLDPTRLANAMCNEQNVYLRKESYYTSNDAEYALVIMIDESGSMSDHGINLMASKIAIMLYEAVKDYKKIKLFVYGHGDCVYRYLDCDRQKNKYVLADRRGQGGQDELSSYRKIVEDVKTYTKLPIVMFNITDSCYCSNENKLAELVKSLREDNEQPAYINLICLSHNESVTRRVNNWNDLIYGNGNWVMYDRLGFGEMWSEKLKKIAEIIKRTVKIK